nr:hypothetical protein [Tanacetum cinerariifolium]
RNKDATTWVWGKRTWDGREKGIGTVPVLLGVREGSIGEGGILGGKDDEDDDMDIEADEEEEEEHPTPAKFVVVASTAADQAPSTEETEPFETDESAATPPPHPAYRMTARISIPVLVPMPSWTDSELPSASRKEDRPEVTLPPQKRLGIALGPRYEVGESSSAAAARLAGGLRADYGFVATMDREIMRDPEREVGYGITDLWDEILETLQGAPVSTDTELGGYMRESEMRVRQDTDEIYMRLDDEQTERQLLAGRLNMLFRDRRAHAYTRHLMETEARMSREAWVRSTDASDLVRDSDESRVTYTDISSPLEELSDIGSPRADDYEHFELPEMLEDPYVEVALQAPPSPDYVPGPEHADDEIVAEDQPYAEDASPIAQSPEYVPESDFEAHPEDDDDEDPEEDPVDYLVEGGDDGDDEEGSSEDDKDDEDDDMDIEADEEEEEHPAPADSVVVASTAADQALSAEETEPFETDDSNTYPAWSDSEIVRLLAISSPPASPLSPWSLPSPQIPFPPLPSILSPPSPVLSPALPPRPIRSLGYRAAMIRLQDEATSTSSPPLQLPSARESSSAAAARPTGGLRVDYDFVAMMDREIMRDPEREMSEIRELQAADRKRQTVISELLRTDHRISTEIVELRTALQGQVTALQGQVTALQAQVTALQGHQGLAGGPTQQELPEEAGSGS